MTALAVATALAAGVAHAAIILVRRFALGSIVFESADVVWTAPVAYLALFSVPLAALIALVPLLPAAILLRAALGVFVTLAAWSVLLLFRELHGAASLLLALGVGVRAAAGRPDADVLARAARRAALALAAIVLASALVVRLGARAAEAFALRRLPAARADAPSVLLVILDTVRGASLGLYGYHRPTTPVLERLAAGSLVFDRALAPAPWTLPSHGTVFTGHPPAALSTARFHQLDRTLPTLAEAFSGAGYATAGFSANHAFAGEESGLARGFAHYESHPVTRGRVLRTATFWSTGLGDRLMSVRSPGRLLRVLAHPDLERLDRPDVDFRSAGSIAASYLRWRGAQQGRPTFAFLNFFDAHEYTPPPGFDTLFTRRPTRFDRYDQAIAYQDHVIGAVLDSLARAGALDRTLVVVTSDHGEHLGEHGLTSHGTSLYIQELHVPLLVRFPGRVPGGRRVAAPVGLRDLAATMTTLAGVASPLPGTSLLRFVPEGAVAEPVLSEVERSVSDLAAAPANRGPMRSIVLGGWHCIRNGDGRPEVYDLTADPAETRDLVATPAGAAAWQACLRVWEAAEPGYRP